MRQDNPGYTYENRESGRAINITRSEYIERDNERRIYILKYILKVSDEFTASMEFDWLTKISSTRQLLISFSGCGFFSVHGLFPELFRLPSLAPLLLFYSRVEALQEFETARFPAAGQNLGRKFARLS